MRGLEGVAWPFELRRTGTFVDGLEAKKGRTNSANWRQVLRPTKNSRPWLFKAGRFGGVSAPSPRGSSGAQQL